MGNKETNSYVIKDINPELWKQFKHKLIDETKKGGKKKIDHEQNYRRLTANR